MFCPRKDCLVLNWDNLCNIGFFCLNPVGENPATEPRDRFIDVMADAFALSLLVRLNVFPPGEKPDVTDFPQSLLLTSNGLNPLPAIGWNGTAASKEVVKVLTTGATANIEREFGIPAPAPPPPEPGSIEDRPNVCRGFIANMLDEPPLLLSSIPVEN